MATNINRAQLDTLFEIREEMNKLHERQARAKGQAQMREATLETRGYLLSVLKLLRQANEKFN